MALLYKEVGITRRRTRCESVVVGALIIAGIACLIAGIVMMIQANTVRKNNEPCQVAKVTRAVLSGCEYSREAHTSGLARFLHEAQERFYELLPHKIAFKKGVMPNEIRQRYKSYDSTPMQIKFVTDEIAKLTKRLEDMNLQENKLTLREKRAKAQLSHWMRHIFPYGVPFAYDYYSGDWLMGPNVFCWSSICFLPMDVGSALPHFQPSTVSEVEIIRNKLMEINQTFTQFVENMRLGVATGMVRTIEECKAGLDGLRGAFREVDIDGPAGILDAPYMKKILVSDFFSKMNSKELEIWKTRHGKAVNESLRQFVIDYVGEPIQRTLRFQTIRLLRIKKWPIVPDQHFQTMVVLRDFGRGEAEKLATDRENYRSDNFSALGEWYVEKEHLLYCTPSNLSSGLASLPLDYVYVNGTKTDRKTTKRLPTGEKLDGKTTYLKLLQYFTTTSKTPDEIYDLGWSMIDQSYPEVLSLAQSVTNENNTQRAKEKFINILNGSEMFYNKKDIPRNESNAVAYKLCSTVSGAKKHCPVRWNAIQNWFAHAREIMATLDPKTIDLFHFTGPFRSTPNCPVQLVPSFNPSSAAPSFQESDSQCTRHSTYTIPFFLQKPGPRNEEWTINAHEARPGHYTQSQGYVENFQEDCFDPISWIQKNTFFLEFSEGWALYAENPLISNYTDTYKYDPLIRYGMLKWQIWRALRLIVDTGLHYKGKSRDWALRLFADYAWDTSDKVEKEVTRYQSIPGQAVTYMLGQLSIMELKQEAEKALGEKFNLKDFHFQVLRHGPSPLNYLKESIYKYIACVKDAESQPDCEDFLRAPNNSGNVKTTHNTEHLPYHSFKVF